MPVTLSAGDRHPMSLPPYAARPCWAQGRAVISVMLGRKSWTVPQTRTPEVAAYTWPPLPRSPLHETTWSASSWSSSSSFSTPSSWRPSSPSSRSAAPASPSCRPRRATGAEWPTTSSTTSMPTSPPPSWASPWPAWAWAGWASRPSPTCSRCPSGWSASTSDAALHTASAIIAFVVITFLTSSSGSWRRSRSPSARTETVTLQPGLPPALVLRGHPADHLALQHGGPGILQALFASSRRPRPSWPTPRRSCA